MFVRPGLVSSGNDYTKICRAKLSSEKTHVILNVPSVVKRGTGYCISSQGSTLRIDTLSKAQLIFSKGKGAFLNLCAPRGANLDNYTDGKEKRHGHHPSHGNGFISLSFLLMTGRLDQKERIQSSSAGLPASMSAGSAAFDPHSRLGYPCTETPAEVGLGVTSLGLATLPARLPS